MVQHLVEFALEGSNLIGGEVQIPFTEVAAHLLGDFADFLFECLPLLGQAGFDDALMLALITRAILDGRVNLDDDRQVIA